MNSFIAVDIARIHARMKALSAFGKNTAGGIDRSFGSTADVAAREHLVALLKTEIGAVVYTDPAANIWAIFQRHATIKMGDSCKG